MTKVSGLKRIGEGAFSKVYRKSSSKVLIVSNCPAKACLAFSGFMNNKIFPNLKHIEHVEDDKVLYEMKLYPKCTAPSKQLNALSYKRYMALKKLHSYARGIHDLQIVFSKLEDKYLINVLYDVMDSMGDFGYGLEFEISPRNISFTKSGNLILLDVFFFREQLTKNREAKRSKRYD